MDSTDAQTSRCLNVGERHHSRAIIVIEKIIDAGCMPSLQSTLHALRNIHEHYARKMYCFKMHQNTWTCGEWDVS